MKRHVQVTLLATVTLAICVCILLGHVHSWAATTPSAPMHELAPAQLAPLVAMAVAAQPATLTAAPDGNALMELLMQGKYLPLVGGVLMLLIGALRAGSIALISPWFKTKIGGYVLGYGGTFALYLGTAWYAGAPVNGQLFALAVAAAIMSAGALEHGSDLLGLVKAAPAAATGAAALLVIVLGALGTSAALEGCAASTQQTIKDDLKAGAVSELDCLQPTLAAAAAPLEPFLESWLRSKIAGGQAANSSDVSAAAQAIKGQAWSCAWATVIVKLLAPSSVASSGTGTTTQGLAAPDVFATSVPPAPALRSQLEDLRASLGGQHFKTAAGYW